MITESHSVSSPIREQLEELHREILPVTDGTVATYIPELAKANPDWFGICIVTTNGGVYEVGDSRQTLPFNPSQSRSSMGSRWRITGAPKSWPKSVSSPRATPSTPSRSTPPPGRRAIR